MAETPILRKTSDTCRKLETISIIIPTFNGEKYIAETIDSILCQSYKDIEIIVVDDGSKDRTQNIVASHGPPVRLISQSNAGVCAARNRGIQESTGEYICLMDQDDFWFRHKLGSQLEQFQRHPETGVVYSSFVNWHANADGQFPDPSSFDLTTSEQEISPEYSGWIYHLFLIDCWMLTSSAIFRAEVFRTIGTFDESLPYGEDWDLWLRISRKYPFIRLNQPTTLYRQHIQQGNRVVRETDYRTELLIKYSQKWGLASQDGRAISRQKFLRQLAIYHAGFAFSQLKGGKPEIAIRSFIKAWRCSPMNLKYLAYIPASLLGWKPKW